MTAVRTNSRPLWCATAILLLAAILRTATLGQETPWHDEVLTLRFMDAPTLASWLDKVLTNDEGVRPFPVYFVVQYFWAQLFGPGELSLRLLSVACSLGALGFLMGTARRLWDAPAAFGAGALYAAALPHIYFAQEIRFYALVTLLVAASCYTFVRAVHSGRRRWWVANALLNVAMPWTHIYAPVIWLAQGGSLLIMFRGHRRLLAQWFGFHIAVCTAFAVWMLQLDYVIKEVYVRQATPTYRELFNAFNVYAGGRFGKLNPALYLPTGVSFDRLLTVGLSFLVVALGADLWKRWRANDDSASPEERFAIVFTLLWLLAPPLFLFAVSQVWKPLFVFRYTLYASLGLYLLAGRALATLHNPWARSLVAALLIAVFANQLSALTNPFRPEYRAASAHIQFESDNTSEVLVLKKLNGIPFAYNSNIPTERITTHEGLGELLADADAHLEAGKTVWILVWQWNDFDTIESHFSDAGCAPERIEFNGVPKPVVYRIDCGVRIARQIY